MFRKLTSLSVVFLLLTSSVSAPAMQRTRARNTDREAEAARAAAAQTTEQQLLLDQQQKETVMPRGLDAPINPDEYVIGPSDEFLLVLRGQAQKELWLRVLPEGTILLPSHGVFAVAGLTITEFRAKLKKTLTQYYRNVEFDCQLVNPRSFVVYVLGEVKDAGAVELHAPFRASAAIISAGGISDKGSLRFIEIRENGEVARTVDLFLFLRMGDTGQNPVLSEGQTVYVPVKQQRASITGQVWNSGTYEFRPGETVGDLVRYAGGTVNYADTNRVVLERYDSRSRASVERYTLDEAQNIELQDRDVVVVPDTRIYEGGAYVQVRGGGGRTGKVFIEEGETLASFMPRFVRLGADHEIDRAVIERESEDGTMEIIQVDLESIISGEGDGAIELQHGDVISIPEADDFVYVTGEVVMPGEIEFQKGLPAERYIALAGGPSRDGSMNKLTIYSIDGNVRDGDRNSMIYRGDTILLERTFRSYIGPLFVGFTSLTSLLLSVIAVSRTN
jgi:protein involved in polysaccharide export with SLBB domain